MGEVEAGVEAYKIVQNLPVATFHDIWATSKTSAITFIVLIVMCLTAFGFILVLIIDDTVFSKYGDGATLNTPGAIIAAIVVGLVGVLLLIFTIIYRLVFIPQKIQKLRKNQVRRSIQNNTDSVNKYINIELKDLEAKQQH